MDAQQLLQQLLESGKKLAQQGLERSSEMVEPVSYTHLTLPTNREV